eukprot:CAMPEP_0201924466 /NCGR_PEP_ID=MMETSP0903-20130614/13171_1 /ASSEMBLY_ACC=CAM_ASM_000552 /TAXON_ID=420261 /ORGANISM="Thalassiosira antarctica, Strain CCMP982" /LENGTH=209 /DNA_ID=CAMNT_0048461983 /DNA_START=52 /DNA_END=682 /DNA_ORIENTATION=-
MTSWLRSILILAVLLSTLTISSSTEVAEDVTSHFLLGRKVQVISGTVTEHATAIGEGDVATMEIAAPNNLPTATNFGDIAMMEMTSNNMQANNPPTKSSNEYHGTRGSASARRLDIEDMLTDMTSRDPEQWSAAEWLLMISSSAFLVGLAAACLRYAAVEAEVEVKICFGVYVCTRSAAGAEVTLMRVVIMGLAKVFPPQRVMELGIVL